MRSGKLILLLGLFIFNSCHTKDPQANLLLGAWTLVGSKSVYETDWKYNGPNSVTNVIFLDYGLIFIGESMLFSGGWCNKAERYAAKEGKITFEFGKPNCIPLVDPQIPAEATIIDITQQSLQIDWGNVKLKFERANR